MADKARGHLAFVHTLEACAKHPLQLAPATGGDGSADAASVADATPVTDSRPLIMRGPMPTRRDFLICVPAAFAALKSTSILAQPAATFYDSRKPIEIIIPFSTGAGSDVASRLLGPFITEHVAGNPPVTPINAPGGAGVIGLNQFALKPHDGYSMLVTASSVWIQWLLGNEEVQFDLKNTVPVIGFPGNTILAIAPSTGFKEAKDLLSPAEPLVMGASDPTGGHVRLILALELLKVADSIQFVFGYDGAGATSIAFEQGEINLCSQATAAYKKNMEPMVEAGTAVPLFQLGILTHDGELVRDPVFPEIKTVREVYIDIYGTEPEGPLWEAVKLFGGVLNVMQTAFLVHSDAPGEAIEALTAGAEKMAVDPDFIQKVSAAVGSDNPITGAEAAAFRRRMQEIDPATLTFVRKMMVEKYGAKGLKI